MPVFYGWVIVAVAFVTMGVGVNARTAFSLLFPPILEEFGWERGVTAGAFSFGFLVSAGLSPFVGWLMDRRGPRVVVEKLAAEVLRAIEAGIFHPNVGWPCKDCPVPGPVLDGGVRENRPGACGGDEPRKGLTTRPAQARCPITSILTAVAAATVR